MIYKTKIELHVSKSHNPAIWEPFGARLFQINEPKPY